MTNLVIYQVNTDSQKNGHPEIDPGGLFSGEDPQKNPALRRWGAGQNLCALEGGGAKAAERVSSFIESYTLEHYRTMSSTLQIGMLSRLMLSKRNPSIEQLKPTLTLGELF
jgi:hypothetical protein